MSYKYILKKYNAIRTKKLHICQKGLDIHFWVVKKEPLLKFGVKIFILYNLLYATGKITIADTNKYLLYPTNTLNRVVEEIISKIENE